MLLHEAKVFLRPLNSASPTRLFLDLGTVKEMARVEINGRDLGVTWCPPWRVAVPAGLPQASDNQLVITVANTWNNRLCADAAWPAQERLTRVGPRLEGRTGTQTVGLLGPVTLQMAVPADGQ
ncbi:MAG: hypothetical protein NTW21_28715 [Verrucomicrobia bacterium]|nr:hypothetical protein [Verrucomicrobiota bacterium]